MKSLLPILETVHGHKDVRYYFSGWENLDNDEDIYQDNNDDNDCNDSNDKKIDDDSNHDLELVD